MQNGACYIRVSTDEQTEFSPDAQLRAIKEYAKKNEILLSKEHIYIDEGISGKKAEKRPAFMKMIATAKTKPKPFDVILVHKFDRFARSRENSVVYKSLLRKEAGIRVISITEALEDDKFSVILEAMLEAMAEYYSLNLADEVKKGMTEKAVRGEFQSSPPFGYQVKDGQLSIIQGEAEFVRFIFNKFANREMNMRQLAIYANDLDIKTKRGNQFERRTIEYILNNPVYIGKVRWTPTGRARRDYHNPDTIIADSTHEPLIDIDLWNRSQEVMKETKELFAKRQKTDATIRTWLHGLVHCGNCGKLLVSVSQNYLQCNNYGKGICKISHCVKSSVVEQLVLEQIKDTFQNNLEINIVPKVSDDEKKNEYDFLQGRLEKYEQRSSRIQTAYQDGIDTLEEYRDNKQKLETERQVIIDQLKQLKELLTGNENGDDIMYRMESAYALLIDSSIPLDIKYKTAHFLINTVVYHKPEKTLTIEYK